MPSEIEFSQPGDVTVPSPSIWADCPKTLLLDKGLGKFIDKDFAGDDGTLPGLNVDADSGTTYVYNATANDAIDVGVTATDNNAVAVCTRPLGKIVRGSGNKLWGEARVALPVLGDMAFFVGFGELVASVRDVIADNPSNAAAAATITESVVGFVSAQVSSAVKTVSAFYTKDAGTRVIVKADVTNSTLLAAADRRNVTAATYVKLGLRFDGRDKIKFYVDGTLVAVQTVDATVAQDKDLAFIVALKTGAATLAVLNVDFIRAASQLRS